MRLESELKSCVEDYLQVGTNQGKWLFLRLNSGDFIEVRGATRRRVKGCPKGTADFIVLQANLVNAYPTHVYINCCRTVFLELKSDTGKQTKEQKEFQERAEDHVASYHIIRSLEDLQEILN